MINRIENILKCDPRTQHSRGVGNDVKFGLLPPLNNDSCDTIQAVKSRLQFVGGKLPQLRLRDFI